MTREEIAHRFRSSGTALLCSADARVQVLDTAFVPVCSSVCIAGPATTARARPDDNAAVHRGVNAASTGDVLIIDGGRDRTRGLFGDILGEASQGKGLAGVIVRGSIRDIAALRAMQFPIWSTTIQPAPATKVVPGEVNAPIKLGEVYINAGDWIVADDDGVVVIASAFVEGAAMAAEATSDKEDTVRARLAAGESTCAIFDIKP